MAGGFVGNARIQVKVSQVTGAGRRELHQFGGMSEVNQANKIRGERALEILRSDVDQRLQESLVRPGQSTGHLRRTIHDVRNAYVTSTEFALGREKFLDQSYAKYWRQIEAGYTGHVGSPIRFLRDGRVKDRQAPKSNSSQFPSRGRTQGQDPGLRMAPGGSRGIWDQVAIIRTPIHAHGYYSGAARSKRAYINRTLADMARDYLVTAGSLNQRFFRDLRG